MNYLTARLHAILWMSPTFDRFVAQRPVVMMLGTLLFCAGKALVVHHGR